MKPDAKEILETIRIISPEDSPMSFPIFELFCRSAGKDYDDKFIRSFMGKEKYFPQIENPEYDENARFREIYVHDSSFEEVDVMAGAKSVLIQGENREKVLSVYKSAIFCHFSPSLNNTKMI